MTPKKSIADALDDLVRQPDPVVSAIAAVLLSAAADPAALHEVSQKEIKERLFALISRQTAQSGNPTDVTKALESIDAYISDQTDHVGPFAGRFSPTATALTDYLERVLENERSEQRIAETTPMVLSKKVLCATLPAPPGTLGAELLTDRILGAVLHLNPAKVRLIVPCQLPAETPPSHVFATLLADLTEQGIEVELIQVSTTAVPVD